MSTYIVTKRNMDKVYNKILDFFDTADFNKKIQYKFIDFKENYDKPTGTSSSYILKDDEKISIMAPHEIHIFPGNLVKITKSEISIKNKQIYFKGLKPIFKAPWYDSVSAFVFRKTDIMTTTALKSFLNSRYGTNGYIDTDSVADAKEYSKGYCDEF